MRIRISPPSWPKPRHRYPSRQQLAFLTDLAFTEAGRQSGHVRISGSIPLRRPPPSSAGRQVTAVSCGYGHDVLHGLRLDSSFLAPSLSVVSKCFRYCLARHFIGEGNPHTAR